VFDELMRARTVAVVGASASNGVTSNIFAWADAMGGPVTYWPVNPKYDRVSGRTSFPSLQDLPDRPDVVAAAVGVQSLAQLVQSAISIGTRCLVSYSDLRGITASDASGVRVSLKTHGMTLVGSNCMGALSIRSGLALYSGDLNSRVLEAGSVGFISHSGSILIGMLSAAPRMRFSSVFSIGNEDATTAADYFLRPR
jgi:acyl-CoA synthetase (NDP forming)